MRSTQPLHWHSSWPDGVEHVQSAPSQVQQQHQQQARAQAQAARSAAQLRQEGVRSATWPNDPSLRGSWVDGVAQQPVQQHSRQQQQLAAGSW